MPHMNDFCKKFTGLFSLFAIMILTLAATGCHTSITPLKPAAIGPPWALPMPGGTLAAAHQPTTRHTGVSPLAMTKAPEPVTLASKTIKNNSTLWFANFSNGTSKTIHIARYRHIWRQSVRVINNLGYHINWQDRRLGIISTDPRSAPEILQWWRPDCTNGSALVESTLNTYRQIIRLVITHAKAPETFHITVEVLVQRRENPRGDLANLAFLGPSAFGGDALPLRASHAGINAPHQFWMTIGRDTPLERKILRLLFKKI